MTSYPSRRKRALGPLSILSALALSVALAVLPGCSGAAQRARAQERGAEAFKPLAPGFATLGYRWDWSAFPVPNSGDRVKFIDAFADIVVTQDTGSKVVVIEAASGRVRWSNEVATRATKFVGPVRDRDPARGDRLVVSSEAEAFILDVHTGSLIARQHFDKVVNTRPLMVGPVAWFGSPHGEMYGHLITRNVKFAGYQMPGSIEQPLVLIAGTTIGGVSQVGEVAFVDATTAGLMGRTKIYGGTASRPVGGDAAMYVASLDQSLYAFNTLGQTLWRKRTSKPVTAQPTLVGPTLYCDVAETGMTAFDALSGKQRWSNPQVGGTVIAVRKKRLMVWDGHAMFLLDADSGTTVERVELPGVVQFSLEKFEDGNLYAVNRAGVVGKFLPR